MAREEEVKERVREAYYGEGKKRRPSNRTYITVLAAVVLVAALYIILTPQGAEFLKPFTEAPVPRTSTEANNAANSVGDNLNDAANIINDLSGSLGA